MIDADVFSGVPENAILWSEDAHIAAPLKEQRRQDCARRQWRSYRGRALQRQRFPDLSEPAERAGKGR
jgi:hypothetical protein